MEQLLATYHSIPLLAVGDGSEALNQVKKLGANLLFIIAIVGVLHGVVKKRFAEVFGFMGLLVVAGVFVFAPEAIKGLSDTFKTWMGL